MRRTWLVMALILAPTAPVLAQLTPQQRVADFVQLAGLFDRNYGPYEWKRDAVGFDLLDIEPWTRRALLANDLDFQDLLASYVASLNDAHDLVVFNSAFFAELPFRVDIYDGRLLIDSIYRPALPVDQYPFTIGDELMTIDGRPAWSALQQLRTYAISANPTSTDRLAADLLTYRPQAVIPRAHELGDAATVEILLASTGRVGRYQIPWSKSGTPITSAGPVPNPRFGSRAHFPRRFASEPLPPRIGAPGEWAGVAPEGPTGFVADRARAGAADDALPGYMEPLRSRLAARVPTENRGLLGLGSRFPIFAPPPGFVQRLGARPGDFFLSGWFPVGDLKIGFLRVPTMHPPSSSTALRLLDVEIAFFNANTDGLVVDVMRNPGGSINFAESVAQRLIPTPFRTVGFELRATASWLAAIDSAVTAAETGGAPPEVVQNLKGIFEEIRRAYGEERGRTAAVSLNPTGSLTLLPAAVACQKPLLLLTDAFSASATDMISAIVQDNHRGFLFGTRTLGAGGNVVSFDGPAFSEATVTITESLMNRGVTIDTGEYPPSPYIENVGVWPDVTVDYMTRANLMTGGQPFVQAFTQAIVNLVRTGSPK